MAVGRLSNFENMLDLDQKKENLKKLLDLVKRDKDKLEASFKKEYHKIKNNYLEYKGRPYTIDEKDFNDVFIKIVDFIESQIRVIEKFNKLSNLPAKNKLSRYYNKLLSEFNLNFDTSYFINYYMNINVFLTLLNQRDISEDYYTILLIEQFTGYDKNIVLIGGNGKGKSSLANFLKGNELDLISVIPSQKTLYFSTNDLNVLLTEKQEIRNLLLENSIKNSKSDNISDQFYNYTTNQFTKLIIAMQAEYTNHLYKKEAIKKLHVVEQTVFEQIQEIYKTIFPEIELNFEMGSKTSLYVTKENENYSVNGLSEGEKVVLYYAISVLMAKENGIIIIDEPETYINPALSNLLWDILINRRSDCQFIFITYSVDFVLGRDNSKISWIKEFTYPYIWEIEFLDDSVDLPKSMLTEILGSSKPILFCEGDNKGSLDYHVYKALLGESYTIIPSNGHMQVITNCTAVNKIDSIGMAYGLIDFDNFDTEKVKILEDSKIFTIPFNEIEMLLLEEKVVNEVMKSIYPADFNRRVLNFMTEFWNSVKINKEKIILDYVKKNADSFTFKEKIVKYSKLDDIKEGLKKISEYNVDIVYESKKMELEKIISDKNYEELLKVCNLKKEISRGLANDLLDKNYEEKAKQRIMNDEELKCYLREKYFSFLFVK